MAYDYKKGKNRIQEILGNDLNCIYSSVLPKNPDFTFENGYYSWISSIFINIQNYDTIMENKEFVEISKILQSFVSEVIEILKSEDIYREIGVRGSSIYATYATRYKYDIYAVAKLSFYINTYIKMLNKLLSKKGFIEIVIGIGVASSEELIVKAGRKGVKIHDNLWIGGATAKASNLSKKANKNNLRNILFSDLTYKYLIDELIEKYINDFTKKPQLWFNKHEEDNYVFYDADIIIENFDKWINETFQ